MIGLGISIVKIIRSSLTTLANHFLSETRDRFISESGEYLIAEDSDDPGPHLLLETDGKLLFENAYILRLENG